MKNQSFLWVGLLIGLVVGGASAQNFRQLLKVGGAIAVADRLGPRIDQALNRLTGQRNLGLDGDTKIVPVLSVGQGKFIGIVQVAGPTDAVRRTTAVAQLETRVPLIGNSRARVLVPISTRSVTNMRRVSGVGVSAVIDLPL
jgi:hypothetical protein